MFQGTCQLMNGRVHSTRDGRPVALGQPEPEFLRRRFEHAQALKEIKREERIRAALADESQGFVERIRLALGLA